MRKKSEGSRLDKETTPTIREKYRLPDMQTVW